MKLNTCNAHKHGIENTHKSNISVFHDIVCHSSCKVEEHEEVGYSVTLFNNWKKIIFENPIDLITYFLNTFSTIF